MKTSLTTCFILALVCCMTPALLPQEAAGFWNNSGKSQCVYLNAGKIVKSGECWVLANTAEGMGYAEVSACFTDSGVGDPSACWDAKNVGLQRTNEFSEDKWESTIDGRPAVIQKRPVMGNGWECHEVRGTQEVMCVLDDVKSDEN